VPAEVAYRPAHDLLGEAEGKEGGPRDKSPGDQAATGLETLDDIEERHIRRVIAKIGKNKGEICEILGISRPTLERKLEKYGIEFE